MTGRPQAKIASEMTDVRHLMTDLTGAHHQRTVSVMIEGPLVVVGETEKKTEIQEMGHLSEMRDEMIVTECHLEKTEELGVIVGLLEMTDLPPEMTDLLPGMTDLPPETPGGIERLQGTGGLITETFGWIKRRWVG